MLKLSFRELNEKYQLKINELYNRFVENLYSETVFKFKYLSILKIDEIVDYHSLNLSEQQEIERFLYGFLSSFKFITFNIGSLSEKEQPTNKKNSKITENNDDKSISRTVDVVFCVEKQCIIVDQISIQLISNIYDQLKKENVAIFNLSNNYLLNDDKQSINLINEIKQETRSLLSKIKFKTNTFISFTIIPIVGYLIRRYFYPTNFFNDPTFFKFDQKYQTELKMQKLVFPDQIYDNDTINDILLQINDEIKQIEFDTSNKKTRKNFFNKNDFVQIKEIVPNPNFTITLAMYLPKLHLFALKMINRPDLESKNIDHEIKFNYEYSHRCLTKFYGFISEKNKIFGFVYEFMSNGTLETFLNTRQIDKTFMMMSINRIYQGIDYLHSNHLIHRDLKPSNILIDHDFLPYISDYDTVTKFTDESLPEKQTRDIGSILYQAPEQEQGTMIVSYSADVYTFGLLIYLMTEKKNLRKDSDYNEKNLNTNTPVLSNVSKNIQELFESCLKQNPEDRIKTHEIKKYLIEETNSFSYFEQNLLLENINESNFINFLYESFVINNGNIEKLNQLFENVYIFIHLYMIKKYDSVATFYLNLGILYYAGFGFYLQKNYQKAEEYLLKSAQLNDPYSFYNLGLLYENGFLGEPDYKKSKKYYELAVQHNFSGGFNGLGNLYSKGLGVEKDYLTAKKFYEKAAQTENPDALFNLGLLFENGYGVEIDLEKASKYYELSAQYGNPEALFNLGNMHYEGKHFAKNYSKAKMYFERAAQLHHPDALNNLGLMYLKGLGVPKDPSFAKNMFEQAAFQNNSEAYNHLAEMYYSGIGVKSDHSEAFDLCKKSADLNNAKALYRLGMFYFKGDVVIKDYSIAKQYFEKSAELKDSDAFLYLGYIYENGFGVNTNISNAIKCFEESGKLNNSEALNHLGDLFFRGLDINQHVQSAKEYYEKAAELNNSDAMVSLGALYIKGLGVKKDYLKAKQYFEKAALLNNSDALFNLGALYENGDGVDVNYVKSLEYYELSGKLDHPMAFLYLGHYYKNGLGTERNYLKAKKYYELAAQYNISDAIHSLGILYFKGNGVEQNYQKAIYYFELASQQNNSYANAQLGMIYQNGLGVSKDIKKAIQYYEKAIECDNPVALKKMGDLYKNGLGVIKDYKKSKDFYERSVNQNNSDALISLGDIYYFGYGYEKNYQKAKHYYELAAQKNNANALYGLGNIYYNGFIGKKDYGKAIEYYERAAQKNHANSLNKLGMIYYNGNIVSIDYSKAKDYFKRAADLNCSAAFYNLGLLYSNDKYKYKDYNKAKEFYENALNLNYKNALVPLGNLYKYGKGVKQDIPTAIYYYTQAAKQKNSDGFYNLGYLYKDGYGVKKNVKIAIEYFLKAADLKNINALLALGNMYTYGEDVQIDYSQAQKYLEKAIKLGSVSAYINLGFLYENCFQPKNYLKAKEYYLLAGNNPTAFKNLGDLYFKGYLGAVDYPLARDYYNKSAQYNYSNAFIMLAKIYKNGLSVKRDYSKAKEYYESAIQNKNTDAFLKLGNLYEKGLGVDINYKKAKEYYESSAKTNNSKAFLKLGNLYINGYGVEKDYFTAIKYYKYSAELNNPTAIYILGCLYSSGDIVPTNIPLSIQYLSKCIKIDTYKIITHHIFDKSISEKDKKNKYRYHALNDLGLLYIIDKNQNIDEAFKNIFDAACAEYPFARNNYGLINQFFKKRIDDIQYWYESASKKSSFALAEYNLGRIKEDENDIEKSIEFYIKASKNEDHPLIFHNFSHFDKRLEISKMFIICLTNLKITKYYLNKSDLELAKQYFIKSLNKISGDQSYRFLFSFPKDKAENQFSYLSVFIFNFPLFNMINQPNVPPELIPILSKHNEINKEQFILPNDDEMKLFESKQNKQSIKSNSKYYYNNSKLTHNFVENEMPSSNVFTNAGQLYEYAIQKDQSKQEFINEIDDIIKKMNSILYTPPYQILFGRICIEKAKPKSFIKDINDLFYEGFGNKI